MSDPCSSAFRGGTKWMAGAIGAIALACGGGSNPNPNPQPGQSDFVSAPMNGQGGARTTDTPTANAAADAGSASADSGTTGSGTNGTRQIEETDIYRVDGNRLYYLNSYRGLLVFDITDIDHPALIGRAPIFGTPVQMLVRNGIAYAIISDWYGATADGQPFHGSIVRAIDATDATNIRVSADVQLRGYLNDARVVGNVLYTVSEDYGWDEFYGNGGTNTGPTVIVSSINIADPTHVYLAGSRSWDGYSGIFNVSENAILMAHDVTNGTGYQSSGMTEIDYVDISDPNGSIVTRGSAVVPGAINGWGANNRRFFLDYDGRYVRVLASQENYTYGQPTQFVLSTLDAGNPDQITSVSQFPIAGNSWDPAARFDSGRMYLSPADSYLDANNATPVQIYDVSNPASPHLAGSLEVSGSVWNFIPEGNRLFALGNDYDPNGTGNDPVVLHYLDVTDPTAPHLIGDSRFAQGWSWSPASDDFKAFTYDSTQGLVVLPFSGWDSNSYQYHNGLQLIQVTSNSIATAGVARTTGWVQRGIFVGNRLVSLSDLALGVIDYSDVQNPRVVNELTLARNVTAAQPNGTTISELTTDWWGNQTNSTLDLLNTSDPDNDHLTGILASVNIPGVNARVFNNGTLSYVLSQVPGTGCAGYWCGNYTSRLTIVDTSTPSAPRIRSSVDVPLNYQNYWWGDGWWYPWGWWNGDSVVQAGGNKLAFLDPGTWNNGGQMVNGSVVIADLSNPDAPAFSSVAEPDAAWWWGEMVAVNSSVFITHWEPQSNDPQHPTVRYYLDEIDLTHAASPSIVRRISVPGVFVGASPDLAQIYTVDWQWAGDQLNNFFDVLNLDGDHAYLRSSTDVQGDTGAIFIQNRQAVFTVEHYDPNTYASSVQLHVLDVSNPDRPVDRASPASSGWGYLLGVLGDRAIVQSGDSAGVLIYQLSTGSAPVYQGFERTRGWWGWNLSRQDNTVFLSTGYWGVQTFQLPQ